MSQFEKKKHEVMNTMVTTVFKYIVYFSLLEQCAKVLVHMYMIDQSDRQGKGRNYT